jgi:hypothetical protein
MRGVLLCVLMWALAALSPSPAWSAYRVNSNEMGIQEFNFTVTEIERAEHASTLSIPGYAKRSAAAARWMMCAYTDLARQRGAKFWAVVAPDEADGLVYLGFPGSERENIAQTLGPRFAGKDVMLASTEVFESFCGMTH